MTNQTHLQDIEDSLFYQVEKGNMSSKRMAEILVSLEKKPNQVSYFDITIKDARTCKLEFNFN